MVERDAAGVASRDVSWESPDVATARPRSRATFDGRALPLSEDHSATLPPHDPEATHLLTVVLDFPDGVRSRSDLVLGGGTGGTRETD